MRLMFSYTHTMNSERGHVVLFERFKLLHQNVTTQARHKPVIRNRCPEPTPSHWTGVSQTTDERRAMR